MDDLPTHASDVFTALNLLLKRGNVLLYLLFQMLDRKALGVDQTEQLSQQKPMMLSEVPCQSCSGLLPVHLAIAMQMVHQMRWVALPSTEGIENGPS
jgi:hypothetical protein